MLRWAVAFALYWGVAGCGDRGAADRTPLTVYTAAEADLLTGYETAFEQRHPDLDIVWVRDSTGIITARLLAERAAPKADAVFALSAVSLMVLKNEGLLAPYAPRGLERLDPRFRDADTTPYWVGQAVWSAAICVNVREAARLKLPMPRTWADLAQPVYRGALSMPNPASSGTGLLAVTAWLQPDEAAGWAYMDALHRNMKAYLHSGSKPCQDAARGETPIGISFDYRAADLKNKGAPIEVVVPVEGVGWDIEGAGLIAGTPREAAARRLLDWAISDEALDLFAKEFAVVAVPARSKSIAGLPADLAARLESMNLAWVATHRERILAEWSRRYEAADAQ